MTPEEKKTVVIISIALLVNAILLFDFTCPQWTRNHLSEYDLYRRSLWEREYEYPTRFWYDFSPCETLNLDDCTDEAEMIYDMSPHINNARGVGGGGGGVSMKYPGDSAVCPVDECAIVPVLGNETHESTFRTTTFSRTSWRYKYMWFLGTFHVVHVSQYESHRFDPSATIYV